MGFSHSICQCLWFPLHCVHGPRGTLFALRAVVWQSEGLLVRFRPGRVKESLSETPNPQSLLTSWLVPRVAADRRWRVSVRVNGWMRGIRCTALWVKARHIYHCRLCLGISRVVPPDCPPGVPIWASPWGHLPVRLCNPTRSQTATGTTSLVPLQGIVAMATTANQRWAPVATVIRLSFLL